MDTVTRKCKQCGELLPIDKFRKYYYSDGRYRICSSCERINSRAKYLRRKAAGGRATESDRKELAAIEQLYEYQRFAGLEPPRRIREQQAALDRISNMLERHMQAIDAAQNELQKWLTEDLTDVPEYYIDIVYEQLTSKYRPIVRIDSDTLTPVYDDTHLGTLQKILERFMAYEDNYYQ